jgi:hypothetical protein
MIIDSLELYLASFTAFKAIYVAAFVTALKAKLTTAQNMPNAEARSSQAESKLVELGEKNNALCDYWQRLKRYIETVFPKAQHKAQTEQAGALYYAKAFRKNWEDGLEMGITAMAYINANSAKLEAGGTVMPNTFEADFIAVYDDFRTTYQEFMNLKQDEERTEDKIDANNDLYDSLIEVCKDGQLIFKRDSGKLERFVFNSVLEAVTPPGAASLRVIVKDGVTFELLSDARVKIQLAGQAAIEQLTDANSDVIFDSLEAGRYRYVITKAG